MKSALPFRDVHLIRGSFIWNHQKPASVCSESVLGSVGGGAELSAVPAHVHREEQGVTWRLVLRTADTWAWAAPSQAQSLGGRGPASAAKVKNHCPEQITPLLQPGLLPASLMILGYFSLP